MRFAAPASMIVLAFISQAFISQALAQTAASSPEQRQQAVNPEKVPIPAPKPQGTIKPGKSDKPAAPAITPAQREAYAAMPVAERLAIQSDLIWSGDLIGAADPDFGDRAIAAVRTFQRHNRFEETGILTPDQRRILATATRNKKDHVGWRLVEDEATPGVQLGVPSKLAPQTELGDTGTRWSSARGEVQIETFREKMGGATLNELFEDLKKKPAARRVEFTSVQGNAFLISGLQGLKKFHVRVVMRDNEARGLTILYDQAMEGIMLPMVDTMTNAFIPFGEAATSSTVRKIQYGSGIVVTQSGHVVTDRQLTENCQSIVIAGFGRADTVAEDTTASIALLQINGARNLRSIAPSSDAPKTTDVTLLGVAAPEMQAGARTVTAISAKLRGVDGARLLLEARPARGFNGGATLDGQGRFIGMISMPKNGSAAATTELSFVPATTIRTLLDGAGLHPPTGRVDANASKDAIVRVVCVRK